MKNTFFDQRPAEKIIEKTTWLLGKFSRPSAQSQGPESEHALCVEEQGSWFLEQSGEIGDVVREHGKERIYVAGFVQF